jgi:plastocyanin
MTPTANNPTPTPAPTPTPTPTPTPNPAVVTISIAGMLGANSYAPNPAMVQVGQQVRWRNDDSVAHTATRSGAGAFDTGVINPGQTSAPITISTPGTLSYLCAIHPTMVGTLNVVQ